MTFAEYFERKHGFGLTWPELVALELLRQEERRRVLSPGVVSPARQWKGSNRLADVRGVDQQSTISRPASFRRKRLAMGLCYCGAAIVTGRAMCAGCLEKNRQKSARYRRNFVAQFKATPPPQEPS